MLKLHYLGHLMWRADSLEKTLMKAGGEGDDREWDGWTASLTWWTWVWAGSGSWWWTGKSGVLLVVHGVTKSWTPLTDWTELNQFCRPEVWNEGINRVVPSLTALRSILPHVSLAFSSCWQFLTSLHVSLISASVVIWHSPFLYVLSTFPFHKDTNNWIKMHPNPISPYFNFMALFPDNITCIVTRA